MSILVKKAGILSTVQDLGRRNFRRFGINPNGAMDRQAARIINILLGNFETEAVLEMHFPAPILEFQKDAIVALGGANFNAKLNNHEVENWKPVFVAKKSVLSFTKKVSGNRAYVSIKGGFAAEKWLDSFSTNLRAGIGGLEGRSLQIGDRIEINSEFKYQNSKYTYKISHQLLPFYSSLPTVRIIAGAEFERLSALSEQDFLKENFIISTNSDRMGFRLSGKPLYLMENVELVSSAVDFGTIQLLPDGQLIILMADHQTSGGYPRIAHVIARDLPVLAQLGAGDKVNFELIPLEEAENLLLEFEKDLNLLKIACSFKNVRNL